MQESIEISLKKSLDYEIKKPYLCENFQGRIYGIENERPDPKRKDLIFIIH